MFCGLVHQDQTLCLIGTRLSPRSRCIRLCCVVWLHIRTVRVRHEPCGDLCSVGIVRQGDPSC